MKKLLLPAILLAVLAGCSSAPKNETPAPITTAGSGTTTPSNTASTSGSQTGNTSGTGLSSPAMASKAPDKRSVYFEYDSFVVKDEFSPAVSAHAKFLNENKGKKISIQGNADERGSREYNLALGQKRADAVRKVMQLQGVTEAQVESVSFGEEKPKALGHDEASWAENRRADIVYPGE